MTKNLVSFVVLNWNGLDDTLLCLDSIRNQSYANYEIIVVDNGSTTSQKTALKSIKDIVLVDLPKNTGFTGGQIAALKIAKGEYLALVNNDSVLDKEWCTEAVEYISNNTRVAAVGGRAYTWNEKEGENSFEETNNFYSYQVVNSVTGHTPTLQSGNIQTPVSSISGAAVMIARQAVDKVGYFDSSFFAYYEETDLFARMKRAGFEVHYNPALKVWHKIAQSTRSNPGFYLYYMHRNRFLFAFKNFDRTNLVSFLFYYFAVEWLGALKAGLLHFGNISIEQRMLLKAGFWNIINMPRTYLHRLGVQRIGHTYNTLLRQDAQEDVSVVIPCYNYAKYVAGSIESAAAQTRQPALILIVDDGSTDNSLEVIQNTVAKLEASHPAIEFRVIHQENSGIVAAKNRGLKEVKTLWTVFLDADDILDKHYISKCMNMQVSSQADVVYTDMQMFGAINTIHSVVPYSKYRLRAVNFIHNSALYRTSILKAVGGYSSEMSVGYEDWELNLKISKISRRFMYLKEPLLKYRRHEGASRDNNAQHKLKDVIKLLERLHPDLYTLRYYCWVETSRARDSLDTLFKYPIRMLLHFYRHTIITLDRIAIKNPLIASFMTSLRKYKSKNE